jgi:ribosomal protein L29
MWKDIRQMSPEEIKEELEALKESRENFLVNVNTDKILKKTI